MPVFDAFMANFEPYPLGDFYRRGHLGTDSLRTTASLTSAEYFDLLRALPADDELQTAPDAAWSTILQWRAAHPELAAKYPATRMIDMIGRRIGFTKARQALRTIEPIVAGTWRFTFSLDDGLPRVFYARTRPRATTDWNDPAQDRTAINPAQTPPRPDGYHILASVASSVDSLPADCEGERDIRRESYIAALEPPMTDVEKREWSGLLDMRLIETQFPDDSAARAFARQFMVQSGRYYREGVRFAPARYTLGDDDVLRVEQTVRLDDGRSAVLQGVRVSTDVIACDW